MSSSKHKVWLRMLAIGIGALMLAGLIAACGGGSSSSGSSGSTSSGSSEEGSGETEPAAGETEPAAGEPEPAAGGSEMVSSGGEEGESLTGKTFTLLTCEPNIFCHAYNTNLTKILEGKGIKVTLLSDNFEPEVQSQHMDQAIATKPDLIGVWADNADAIVPALARAKAAGIPIVNIDAPLKEEGEEYVNYEIVADNHALGKFAAENLIEGMEKAGYKKGRIIAITGTMGTLIEENRMESFEEVLAEHPEFELAEPQDGNWDPVESGKIALQLFTKYKNQGGVQGAYGMADYQAAAMIQAANQLGIKAGTKPGDTVFTGSNCTTSGIPLMEKGTLWGDATQSPIVESEEAAGRIIEWFEGKEIPKTTTAKEKRFTAETYKPYVGICSEWPE